MSTHKTVKAWHWCKADMTTQYSGEKITVGGTLTAKGELVLCKNGMHASLCPFDALRYAPGPMLCRVELTGQLENGDDKLCARNRKVLWAINADHLLHEFACLCAERALKRAKVDDPRSLAAIQAKRDWLAGKITDTELDAAWAAAWAAAGAAPRDAPRDAAGAAAWAATGAAAEAATGAAAEAATGAAEIKWQKVTLLKLIQKQRTLGGQQMSTHNILGAVILALIGGLIFAATVKIAGFWPAVGIWATAFALSALLSFGVYLLCK